MGLSSNIYKIPVNVLLPLGTNAGTGNPNKWYRKVRSFQYKREKGYSAQGITHFPKTFHLDELFHLNSPLNYLILCTNDKHSCFFSAKKIPLPFDGIKIFLRNFRTNSDKAKWRVTQCGISALVSQTSFRGKTSSGVNCFLMLGWISVSLILFLLKNSNRGLDKIVVL